MGKGKEQKITNVQYSEWINLSISRETSRCGWCVLQSVRWNMRTNAGEALELGVGD
jgi:hypothetical protein